MNLLFADDNNFTTQTRMMLLGDTYGHNVELASTLADLHITFKADKYDVVILDPTIENGYHCLEYMLAIDTRQRMLMVSNAITKSDPMGCEHRRKNYRRRQLTNPTSIKNILRMVEGFDGFLCNWYDADTSKTV